MVLEVAILQIKEGMSHKFELDFAKASQYIINIEGYIKHDLRKCMEEEDKYILLVEWDALEDHTIGFRKSPQYEKWKEILHHYYDPFPVVEHYK